MSLVFTEKHKEVFNAGKTADVRLLQAGNRTGKTTLGMAEVDYHIPSEEREMQTNIDRVTGNFQVCLGEGHDISLGLKRLEAAYIEFALQQAKYNQSKAAKLLGISRGGLRIKLKQYFGNTYL